MSKQLVKLTGAGWITENSVGHIVEAVPHTGYPARKGVYYWKGYEIFTQPDTDDHYETEWAAEIFERCNPQPEPVKSAMTITQEQLEKAARAFFEWDTEYHPEPKPTWDNRTEEQTDVWKEGVSTILTTLGISVEGENGAS